jgi:Zn-dependent membrane protease YugP
MYLGYYSFSYLWLILPALLLTIWAQFKVKSTFKKYSQYAVDVSGEEACQMIQQANGISIPVQPTAGELTDHYDPRSNSIHLSQPVYDKKTISAIGVAAHETGHALQYAENYGPIRFRMALVPVTNFASGISPYLIMFGLIAGIEMLSYIGIALFSVAVLFQLVTLPVEFNASSRAVAALAQSGRFSDEELHGVKKVLSAAALTYVAALLVSLANLLRLVLIVSGRSRRRR